MSRAETNSIDPEPPAVRERGSPGWLVWGLLFVVVVYPLSIGPAAMLHSRFRLARPVIEAIYAPVVFLIEHSKPAEKFFSWYVEKVWRVK
jgi:hypothetical protein